MDKLSDEELRAIELDENRHRLALSDFESSKARLAQTRQTEAELKAKARRGGLFPPQVGAKSRPHRATGKKKTGRPKGSTTGGSERDVEKETGVSKAEQHRVEKHVAIAERFPFMQRDGAFTPSSLLF